MQADVVELLEELVAAPSVNPRLAPNASQAESEFNAYTLRLERTAQRLGMATFRQSVPFDGENLLITLAGSRTPSVGGKLLLFDAHQDTVPVQGMTIDPFTPTRSDGRLYGRGACDVKGGLAAMLVAMAEMMHLPTRPTVVLACTVNEEFGFTGARALPQLWQSTNGPLARKPDAAIVAEPTALDVVVAHKGVARWQLHTRGKATHSSRPELGISAVYRMAPILQIIERYDEILATRGAHPLCGRAAISVGLIRGGSAPNIVPDHCVIDIDRRLVPGEDPHGAQQDLLAYLYEQLGSQYAFDLDPPSMTGLALDSTDNATLASQLAEVATKCVGRCATVGVPYATDAAVLAAAGVPTVVFGPGDIAQAHTVDEWIDVEQLRGAVQIYRRFAEQFTT